MTPDELAKLSDLNTTLINCSLNGKPDCEFEFYFDYSYLNCYRLKRPSSGQKETTESDFKLKLVLYSAVRRGDAYNLQAGFNVFIENKNAYPLLSQPIALLPGYAKSVVLSRNVYNQYRWPYSECGVLVDGDDDNAGHNSLVVELADRSVFDLALATNYSYSRQLCYAVCKQVLMNQQYNCTAYASYLLPNVVLCEFSTKPLQPSGFSTYCPPRCPLECSQSIYKKTIYTYPYTQAYIYAENNVSRFDFSHDYPYVNALDRRNESTIHEIEIRLADSFYTLYEEEEKMGAEDLLGILGGHLHLFLGMSLLSFIEIVELVAFVVHTLRQRWKANVRRRRLIKYNRYRMRDCVDKETQT